MGKIIGGSMYLNNLVYIRGHPSDYKSWFGNSYNYDVDVLEYFKRSENQCGRYKNDCKCNYFATNFDKKKCEILAKNHATGGPLIVNDIPFVSQFGNAVLESARLLGFPIVDLNADHYTGNQILDILITFYFQKNTFPKVLWKHK